LFVETYLSLKKKWTAEWFLFGGSPYSPYPYSSPLYKLEIKVIKTRAVYENGHLSLTVKDTTHQVFFFYGMFS